MYASKVISSHQIFEKNYEVQFHLQVVYVFSLDRFVLKFDRQLPNTKFHLDPLNSIGKETRGQNTVL
jgi:hypothetical protein